MTITDRVGGALQGIPSVLSARGDGGRFRQYKVDELIVKGEMSYVFKGTELGSNASCAIKIVSSIFFKKNYELSSAVLLQEANLLRSFAGEEAIVNCQAAERSPDGYTYIALDFIEGRTIKELIDRNGPFTAEEAALRVVEVSGTVKKMHDLNPEVLHRDIKAEDLFIGRNGRVVMVDLGLAAWYTLSGAFAPSCWTIAGTPAYMAPECFYGTFSKRTDVYASGVLIYFMLTGRIPHMVKGSSSPISLRRIDNEEIDFSLISDIKMRSIARQCLAHNPVYRFSDMEELRAETFRSFPQLEGKV